MESTVYRLRNVVLGFKANGPIMVLTLFYYRTSERSDNAADCSIIVLSKTPIMLLILFYYRTIKRSDNGADTVLLSYYRRVR